MLGASANSGVQVFGIIFLGAKILEIAAPVPVEPVSAQTVAGVQCKSDQARLVESALGHRYTDQAVQVQLHANSASVKNALVVLFVHVLVAQAAILPTC